MSRDSLSRRFAPTIPADLNDPPKFGQLTETTKDVLVYELRKFFSAAQVSSSRRTELPTVEKYVSFDDGNDAFSTAASIVRKFPERLERLPHVAIIASSTQEKKLTIGPPFVAHVQDPPRILATEPEPYSLSDGDMLAVRVRTMPTTWIVEEIKFTANRFPSSDPIGAATAEDVARVYNEQALYSHAEVVESGGDSYVQILAGGLKTRGKTPLEIEIHPDSENADEIFGVGRRGEILDIGGTAPDVTLTSDDDLWSEDDVGRYVVLSNSEKSYFNDGRFLITDFNTDELTIESKYGQNETDSPAEWFIGLRDDYQNTTRPPKNRYVQAGDLSIQVMVLCQDETTRGEVVDLVLSFFGFFLEEKYFTFHGRSGFSGQTTENEHYQITINPPMSEAGEAEFPRPGDATGKIYTNSFSVNVTTTLYLDREVYFPGTTTPFITSESTFVYDESLPLSGEVEE